ncbi:MAG TPA: hypothetical protein PK573_15290, partial [Spirochaetota bacterium]|nr:hypothetical protein [Spirochaetota bacterium]
YKDIERLFKHAYEFIISGDERLSLRLLSQLGNQYILINRDRGSLSIKPYNNYIQFLTANSLTPRNRIGYSFFGDNIHVQILSEIYELRRPRTLTVVYQENGNALFIYVINESGNIFSFVKTKTTLEESLVYMYSFCRNVIAQMNSRASRPLINEMVNFNRLSVDKFGKTAVVNESKRIEDVYLLKYQTKRSLSAEIFKHKAEQSLYRLKNSDGTASDPVTIKGIAERVQEGKISLQPGPVIIDEIVIMDRTEEDREVGSTLYFVEKYRLETLLEKGQ